MATEVTATTTEAGSSQVAAVAPVTQLRGSLARPAREPKPTHVLEGQVERTNTRGFVVAGEWANVSRYRPLAVPPRGAEVRVEVDEDGWIQDLEVLSRPPVEISGSDRINLRLSVLQAAASFGSGQDWADNVVIATAEKWLAWVQA
ncbi:MAG TPA: hypothetical protein VGJ60_07140 [Chloroflexota bacterium]